MFLERMCSQICSIFPPDCRNARAFGPIALAVALHAELLGCSGHTNPAVKSSNGAPTAPAPRAPTRAAAGWAYVESAELPLRLRLPFASEWQRHETPTSLRLEHPGEASKIVIRLWPSSRLVTAEHCFTELLLLAPEAARAQQLFAAEPTRNKPTSETAGLFVNQDFAPGADFRGWARGSLQPAGKEKKVVVGTVIAVAAGVGRCLALVATTEASGENAEQQLANRFAWMVEGAIQNLTVRTVESRVGETPRVR